MKKIIYYVAVSLDGYISTVDEDMSVWAQNSSGIDQYLEDLRSFDTVIMGKKTYEYGYKFGLKPGKPAYDHMEHYIFSNKLQFKDPHEKVHVCRPDLTFIKELKKKGGTDIYLCGGGEFAGWLLENHMIDILKIKLNPVIIGRGVRLFGSSDKQFKMEMIETSTYEEGLLINTYRIIYSDIDSNP